VKVISNFASAFATSLIIAAFSFIFFFGVPRLSLVLTLVWIGIVVFGFTSSNGVPSGFFLVRLWLAMGSSFYPG